MRKMERTDDLTAEEIALVRASDNRASRENRLERESAASNRLSNRRNKLSNARSKSSQSKKTSKRAKTQEKKTEADSEERLAQVIAVLLGLSGLLLLLALISYSRLDQANTDIGIIELVGLLSNDPEIAARADTTENWLGLVGAFLANFFLNGTIGWFALLVPGLLGLWSYSIFSKKDLSLLIHRSLFVLLLGLLFASFVGTIRDISWAPEIAYEMAGAVGTFVSSVLSGLIGSAGAFLLLLAGIVITALYTFEADLRQATSRISSHVNLLWKRSKATAQKVRAAARYEGATTEGKHLEQGRNESKAKRPLSDEEPARMIRRFREIEQEGNPTKQSNVLIEVEVGHSTTPSVSPTQNQVEIIPQESNVALSRAPADEPPKEGEMPKLTVHVEEGETDADLETNEAGNLIENLKDEQIEYDAPSIELLVPQGLHEEIEDLELKTNARLLQEKLRTFNIEIEDLTVTPGPVVTLFEFIPAAGIKLSQIESLGDDIALALKARGIRIIAPIPGKGTVGVEIPNSHPALVRIRSVLNTVKFREADLHLPLALGKTTVGEVYCADLAKMPHLLIAGATGAGKSVGINSILASLLYKMHPSDLKLAIIDPKKIELTQYKSLIDHFLVKCPDTDEDIVTDPQNAVTLLKSLELEMDRRYDMLANSGQRNLFDYNRKIEEGTLKPTPKVPHGKLPYIVLIIDELADLMITAAKEVEEPIARLAQLARAIGIHIIVATQRPSVDVLTGMIKANFPARIAYQVATKVDSRTILDMNGAEQLLGNGDMLYLPGGRPKPLRLQNAFITTEEVEDICEHIGSQKGYSHPFTLPSVTEKMKESTEGPLGERDDLFDEAAHLVVRYQQGSVSLIQRRLKVGYARAARIVDELEDADIVGPFDGSKAREVLLESEAELEAYL